MQLKIGFVSFWENGDIEEFKERAFFTPLRRYNIEYKVCNPFIEICDLVFVGVFGDLSIENLKGNPILVSFRTEPRHWFSNNERFCKYYIGFYNDSQNTLYYPLWIIYGWDLLETKNKPKLLKTDFCSFIYTNPNCKRRNEVFDFISKNYKKVDSIGKHNNNMNFILPKKDFVYPSRYKFNFAFENTQSDEKYEYITEKIIWSYVYNSVPLYWGNSNITKYFNEKSFINCNGLSNEQILEKIKLLDNDDESFLSVLNENPFLNNITIDEYINKFYDKFILFIKKILLKEKHDITI